MALTKVVLFALLASSAQAVLNLQRSVTLHRKGQKGNASSNNCVDCPCCGEEGDHNHKPGCPMSGGVWNAEFMVNLDGKTMKNFTVEVHPEWAPKGAKRFHELVDMNFFKDVRFFRVVSGFMAQFGINGDPQFQSKWRNANIQDDPAKESNKRGYMTFANAGPNTRSTQLFINFKDNKFLDSQGFPPFAKVTKGMDTVDHLYSGYGEGAPAGNGPDQNMIQMQGNSYLTKSFPKLSYIVGCSVVYPEEKKEKDL
jgi:peptidyl-prolyl cis-trans isomerase A (cyclophilin A)